MRLIKVHLGLIQYLNVELRKKRTSAELIKFLKDLGERYCKVMLQEYKNLFLIFDKSYKEQKAKYDKMQTLKKDLTRCLKMLRYLDEKMEKAGMNRQRRRQFWRDFYRDGHIRTDVFEELQKELGA
jgi:hypothetical protein